MDVVRLGTSELRVAPLAVGAMFWGTRVGEELAHDLLDRALDAGVNFVDTANNYAFWEPGAVGDESEVCLGRWIARRGAAERDRLVLATKIGARPVRPGLGTDQALGLSRQAVEQQVVDSLRRLGVDHVDLLYAHIDDDSTPLEETLDALQEIVARGWARAVAASNYTAGRLGAALDLGTSEVSYVALQNRFTYLSPTPGTDLGRQVLLDDAVQAVCREREVSMVAYSTLLEGAYSRPGRALPEAYRRPSTARALEVLAEAACELGLDPSQTVLAWLAHRADPVIPVVGVSGPEQLDRAVAAVATTVPALVVDQLESARRQTA